MTKLFHCRTLHVIKLMIISLGYCSKRTFWLAWMDRSIKLGHGGTVLQSQIIEYTNTSINVPVLSFSNGLGTSGRWTFQQQYSNYPFCRVGSVGSVSASRTVGREFASRPGHTKDHHKKAG